MKCIGAHGSSLPGIGLPPIAFNRAATDRFVAYPNNFTLNAELFQLLCNLSQSDGCITLLARAPVDN